MRKDTWKAERNAGVMMAVVNAGETYAEVARQFGISKPMVYAILVGCAERGMFVPKQKRMPGIYKRLYGVSTWKLAPNADRTYTAGAMPTDFKYQRMLKMLQKAKVEKRAMGRPDSSAGRNADIIDMLEMGDSPKQVADAFGLDVQRIYQIRKKHKEQT